MNIIKDKEERIKFANNNPNMKYEELAKIFGVKEESVRRFFQRNQLPNKKINAQSTRSDIPLSDRIAKKIKSSPKNLRELSDFFNVAPKAILAGVADLQKRNIMK